MTIRQLNLSFEEKDFKKFWKLKTELIRSKGEFLSWENFFKEISKIFDRELMEKIKREYHEEEGIAGIL